MISFKLRRRVSVLAFTVGITTAVLGQTPQASSWEGAAGSLSTQRALYVVTIAHPKSRHACRMQSINSTEIVCEHHGRTTVYRAEDVAALISPGTHVRWYLYAAGFLAGSGAAAWGTVVLASVCVPCAVGTGAVAFVLFWMAPLSALLTDGDNPDELLYLAPGQALKLKLN